MNKSKYLFLVSMFVAVSLVSTSYKGCDTVPVFENQGRKPSCIDTTKAQHRFYYTYQFMRDYQQTVDYNIFAGNAGPNVQDAFLNKGNILEIPNIISPGINSYEHLIIKYPGGLDEMQSKLGTYWFKNRINDPIYQDGYACGIDSLEGILDSNYYGTIGVSLVGEKHGLAWSFVFVGLMRIVYPTLTDLYVQGCLAHELGHQIGLDGNAHYFHGGYDVDKCIMHKPLTSELIGRGGGLVFCDDHICFLYQHTDTIGQTDNLMEAGISSDKNISLKISMEKTTYVEDEDIFLNFSIKNSGSSIDSLRKLGSKLTQGIVLKDSKGKSSYFKGIDILTADDPYYKMQPGEERSYETELIDHYGTRSNNVLIIGTHYDLPAGEYTVQIVCTKNDYGKNIRSNVLAFSVIAPHDSENTALYELKQIYQLPPTNEQLNRYRDFSYKYPESIYMDKSFNYYVALTDGKSLNQVKDVIEDCKWFVKRKPNSHYAERSLNVCHDYIVASNYVGKDDFNEFLDFVKQTYPNTRASKTATKLRGDK